MKKKYIVELTDSDRAFLKGCVDKGKNTAYEIKHGSYFTESGCGGACLDGYPYSRSVWMSCTDSLQCQAEFCGAWLVWGVIPRNAAKAVARPET